MSSYKSAFSLSDLEQELETIDKSTLSRVIRLFHENLLIHSIDDGSGSVKYSLCRSDCSCSVGDLHVHFYCNKCKHTYCLESISIPTLQLPEGFRVDGVNFVLKGLCGGCSKNETQLHKFCIIFVKRKKIFFIDRVI